MEEDTESDEMESEEDDPASEEDNLECAFSDNESLPDYLPTEVFQQGVDNPLAEECLSTTDTGQDPEPKDTDDGLPAFNDNLFLQQEQEKDDSVFNSLTKPASPFSLQDGLLYKTCIPNRKRETTIAQLVLPKSYRETVLRFVHHAPTAGHHGRKKILRGIQNRFFWLGVPPDEADLCDCCQVCQLTNRSKPARAPLPIMDKLFHRIDMDMIGP